MPRKCLSCIAIYFYLQVLRPSKTVINENRIPLTYCSIVKHIVQVVAYSLNEGEKPQGGKETTFSAEWPRQRNFAASITTHSRSKYRKYANRSMQIFRIEFA